VMSWIYNKPASVVEGLDWKDECRGYKYVNTLPSTRGRGVDL
jgi:hypothetical protein